MTRAYLIDHLGNVEETTDRAFYRAIFGHNPRVATAEDEARKARIKLLEVIEREERIKAHRQREAVIREGTRDGESYDDYRRRLNDPLCRAAQRVNERYAQALRRAA